MRSLPRSAVVPLATVEGVEWFALTKDAWTPEMGDAGLPNALAGCEDWLDTARVVEALDLVITVDTAIAHIAGGLGVPCWLLIAAVPDMRWMLGRSDSPWYSSVVLYRQAIAGEWTPVLERVAADLQQHVYAQPHEGGRVSEPMRATTVSDSQGVWEVRTLPNGMQTRVLLRYGLQPIGGYTAQQVAKLEASTARDK